MGTGLHKFRVTVPDGRTVLGRVEVDGEELRGVTAFEVYGDVEGMTKLTVTLFGDIEIDGEAKLIKQWRQARPWWQRLRWRLGIG